MSNNMNDNYSRCNECRKDRNVRSDDRHDHCDNRYDRRDDRHDHCDDRHDRRDNRHDNRRDRCNCNNHWPWR